MNKLKSIAFPNLSTWHNFSQRSRLSRWPDLRQGCTVTTENVRKLNGSFLRCSLCFHLSPILTQNSALYTPPKRDSFIPQALAVKVDFTEDFVSILGKGRLLNNPDQTPPFPKVLSSPGASTSQASSLYHTEQCSRSLASFSKLPCSHLSEPTLDTSLSKTVGECVCVCVKNNIFLLHQHLQLLVNFIFK